MEQKITIGNVCFIHDKKQSKVLLLKRKNEPMRGLTTGVGGKTRFDEDIKTSCVREIKEETGLDVKDIRLKGVIKTLFDGKDSSWILFVYVASSFDGTLIECNEGDLCWVDQKDADAYLIGFLKNILPHVLHGDGFIEGTVRHDAGGNVIEENLHCH